MRDEPQALLSQAGDGRAVSAGIDAAIALAAETLTSFGHLRLRVSGTSMLPALRPGDVVELRSCGSTPAGPGEIVMFRRDGGLVVHRVLRRFDTCLVTQGDSLAAPDAPVAHAEVLGRVVGLSRGGRSERAGRSLRPARRITRWLFRRFDLVTRLFLRWQRISARAAA